MLQEKTKVYIYTRVSTAMQIDGYSLDAQKARMKAYADFNDYQIVGEYEDAGKSGKSIEGRASFCRMMEDIKSGKDGVAYVLVFKLSRFGRNAADVLSTLQVMQDFGVNLICVEDGIDSSKDAGKLMISVLSAVAEIERENIRVQTMEGRIQKAREGCKWSFQISGDPRLSETCSSKWHLSPFQRNIDSCHPEEPRLLRKNRLWPPQTRKDSRHPERISSGSTGELFAGGRPARGHRIGRIVERRTGQAVGAVQTIRTSQPQQGGTGAFIIRPCQVPHLRCWNVQQQMHQTKERWHTL